MDARLVFAVELEERDSAMAARIDVLAETSAEVERIRSRAAEIRARIEGMPAERAHLAEAGAAVALGLDEAKAALAEAEAALDRARGNDVREAARLAALRAAATVRADEERRDRLATRRATLDQEAERFEAEAVEVGRAAREVAARLEGSSRVSPTAAPEPGLSGVIEWGARAHAAVLLARGGLESERDRIVREANELAASVLGEPLYTGSVALVRRRLQQELA